MAEIAGFSYFEFEVDKSGGVVDKAARAQLVHAITQDNSITDVFVISHGWNNNMDEARDLYRRFFATLRTALDGGNYGFVQRKFAVVGVFWPSKKFTDAELIPGGAASVTPPDSMKIAAEQIDEFKADAGRIFDNKDAAELLLQAKALLPKLANNAAVQKEYVELIRQLPDLRAPDYEDAADTFFGMPGDKVMSAMAKPFMPRIKPSTKGGATSLGSASGGAVGIGSVLSGIGNAALNVLNLTTYYQMKKRAGLIGRGALADLLRDLRASKLHLIGHSFGGRLVTAAALGPDGRAQPPLATMTLLQAAFSHFGFAQKYDGTHDGFFRDVVAKTRISGPLLITHSIQDKAVGIAYPLASRLAGQNASAIGDANDPYGGIGRNGAQHTPERIAMPLTSNIVASQLTSGKPHNLNGDTVITGHSDIKEKPEIANAILCAVSKT